MNPLRLLMVTDRFWPVVDPDTLAAEQLCHALVSRGHVVRVLTRSYNKYWSGRLRIGDLGVQRLAYCTNSRLGKSRLVRHLNQWLDSNHQEIDFLLAHPLDELSGPLIQFAARHEIPVLLWQPSACDLARWSAGINRLHYTWPIEKSVVRWIVAHPAQTDQLLSFGVDVARVGVFEPCFDGTTLVETTRAEARQALAENQRVLAIQANEPLIVCAGSWDSAKGAIELVEAWRWVRQSFPCGKLWIIGDGAEASKIWDHVRYRHLENEIVMVGWFDDWSDLVRAADLLVQTEMSLAPPFPALAAMWHGLPILGATTDRSTDRWLRDGDNGFEYSPSDPRQLAKRTIDILEQQSIREAVVQRARILVQAQHDLATAISRFEQVACRLANRREKVQY